MASIRPNHEASQEAPGPEIAGDTSFVATLRLAARDIPPERFMHMLNCIATVVAEAPRYAALFAPEFATTIVV